MTHNSDKLHWYAFSFSYQAHNCTGYASAYAGYPEQLVTIPRIERAKVAAGISTSGTAVLIGLSYLGLATKEEITNLG